MDKLLRIKNREILHETISEYSRRGNYVRIYPSKGSDLYDCFFFTGARPMNRFLYKCLYTDELLPRQQDTTVTQLNYKIQGIDTVKSYEETKKSIQQ